MTDYTEFDAMLLEAIRSKPQDFTGLTTTRSLDAQAESLGVVDRYGSPVDADRIFDRRLQALRKRGLIRYTGTKWETA